MTELIAMFTEVATAIFAQVVVIADTITESPLMVFTVAFLFVGGCVGIFGRLLARR